ncbi:MAG: 2-amino-4-hydroxy-6-hydroxymethyldihydropteridine diphosphokinase [Chitinophagales bacterium]
MNIWLLLGSNVGDRLGYLRTAARQINIQVGPVCAVSSIYETAAWGNTRQQAFLNCCMQVRADLEPEVLLSTTQQIEAEVGRKRREHWGPREIDIDILLWDAPTWSSPSLTVPHPLLAARRFTLVPLSEIAGELVHPISHQTIAALLASCKDKSEVQLFEKAEFFGNF